MLLLRRNADLHVEVDAAIEGAELSLRRAKARGREVSQVVSAMRTMRERNHFIEQLDGIMGGV